MDAGATEAVREVRQGMEGWQNAFLGSAISGAFLGRFWGKTLPPAVFVLTPLPGSG